MSSLMDCHQQRLERICLLPPGYSLNVSAQERSLALIVQTPQQPVLLQCLIRLSKSEWSLFETLLTSATYCSYAKLLASLRCESEVSCQEQVKQAQAQRQLSLLTGPLHYTIFRLKKKLQRINLTIVAVFQAGYLLFYLHDQFQV